MSDPFVCRRLAMAIALGSFASFGCGKRDPDSTASKDAPPRKIETYWDIRKDFKTDLKIKGPAPQEWEPEKPPPGVTEVTFPSGSLKLKAWVARPILHVSPMPAIVYFHGGFAFGAGDLADCKPFLDAGFLVMCPMLRGENGNPGHFELLMGEVDDGAAAVIWLSKQKNYPVNNERIYTFGHSIGGGVSALLSLRPDLPIRAGGSSSGLYEPADIARFSQNKLFDRNNPREYTMRTMFGYFAEMDRPHYAYIGASESNFLKTAEMAKKEVPHSNYLHIATVPGDHHSALPNAIQAFLKTIKKNDP